MQNCRHHSSFFHFPCTWFKSHSFMRYDFSKRTYSERHFSLCCLQMQNGGGCQNKKEKCQWNPPLYNQLFDNLTVADHGAHGQHAPLVFLISLGNYSIMVLIYLILSMGYSPHLNTSKKIKFIATAACNTVAQQLRRFMLYCKVIDLMLWLIIEVLCLSLGLWPLLRNSNTIWIIPL